MATIILAFAAAAAAFVAAAATTTAATTTSGEGIGVKDVYFAGFFPMRGNEKKIGDGIMPAIDLAIRHINESPDILPDYKLHMIWNDTEVGINKI
jgi:Spy/CpxP family protein refolding chaperone